MQRPAITAVFLHVIALKELQPLGADAADLGAHGAEPLHPRAGCQHLVGHIQGHHHQGHARFEHDVRGFRVNVNVELCRRCDIAHLEIGPAHQHDLLHAADDIGRLFKRHRDVGQGAKRAQGHRMRGLTPQGFNNEINAMLCLQRHRRIGQLRAIQPRLPMHIFRRDQLALDRAVAARVNPRLWLSSQFTDDPAVLFGELQGHIACHGRHPQNLQLGTGQRQQNGKGIVLPGVSVDDDLAGH